MSFLEVAWTSEDPGLAHTLAEAAKRPSWDPERLIVEATLCEWHARRCWQQIGDQEGFHRAEQKVSSRNRHRRSRDQGAALQG